MISLGMMFCLQNCGKNIILILISEGKAGRTVKLEQAQSLSQKLILTQAMRQSLDCLRLSAVELSEYVQEISLSNPLLDVQTPTYYETELPSETVPPEREAVELNERILPRLSVNAEYSALLTTCGDPEVQRYVREKLTEARALIKGVHTRCDTLLRLLTLIAAEQRDFFCADGALAPVTMQQLAEKLGVSTSTVSRAVQNKYIQFQGCVLPLRGFFTTAIRSDAAVSSQAVKQRIRGLIRAEDPAAPLSDEALRLALSALGIEVSRRAVAKYRMAMEIPSSSERRRH